LARILEAQAEMSAALPNRDPIMRLVTQYAMELSGATSASIGVRDGDEMYMPVSEGFTNELEGTRFPLASTLLGHCLLTGEQYYVPDLQLITPARGEIALAAGIRTFLAVPLRHQDHVVAALSVAAPQAHAFGEDKVLIVRLLSRLAGSKLAHAEAFNEFSVALAEARQARTETAEFAGMIAHELGSPIAAIRNASEVLGMETLDPHQARASDLIEVESRALRLLLGDLRAASSLERESFDLHQRVVSLDALLVEAGNFARTVAGSHPIHVHAGSSLEIWVDPGRIAQVLRNLVTNAVKYTPPGTSIEMRSWRETDGHPDRVWIAVVDQGPGVAPEDMERIFARFGRANHHVNAAIPGLGLGLYLSQRIVEAHGGEFVVTSTPGQGSSFAFSVPLAP
jgi:signal transduction histidine kinase